MEPKYLPSHITPEAHLDNFDKSRYEVRSGRPAGGAGNTWREEREERYIGDKREREERGHNFIFDWN